MRHRRLFAALILAVSSLATAPAFADAIRADGFNYSDEVTVIGLKDGRLQTNIKGTDKLFDLDKVESIELSNQPKFNEAETSRKDSKKAAGLYKSAVQNINDKKLKVLAELRAVGPADGDGMWSDAVGYFLDAYGAAPTESVWKLRPTNLPPATSTMLKESADRISGKLSAFKADAAIKNLKGLELEILTKANDPRAAALASELGTGAAGAPAPEGPKAAAVGNAVPAAGGAVKNPEASAAQADAQLQRSVTPEAAIQLFETKAQALEAEHKMEEAAATWLRIPAHYPASTAAPAAMLHAADLQKSLKNDDEAKHLYQEIVDKYANSAAAVRATAALRAK